MLQNLTRGHTETESILLSLHYLKKVMFIVTKDVRLGANSNEQNGSVSLGITVLSVSASVHLH